MKRVSGQPSARSIFIFLILTFMAACTPPATPMPTLPPPAREQSAWGDIITIAHAPVSAAPALAVHANGQPMLAWASPDSEKMRLYARHALTGQPVILVLPAYYPAEVALFPAQGDDFHLLWIDRTRDAAIMRLLGARMTPDVVAQLGPNALAPDPVYHYTALSTAENGLLIVWSGGLIAEPTLYLQSLDAQGRVRFPLTLVNDSDYPALAQTPAGERWLFWVLRGRDVLQAPLLEETIGTVTPVTLLPPLAATDYIERMTAAVDATHAYLFWQIIRADGTPEVWFTTGLLTASQLWQPPRLLKINMTESQSFQTDLQSRRVNAAQEDAAGQGVHWLMPPNQTTTVVTTAVNIGDTVGVLYWRDGTVVGYDAVAQTGVLLGTPLLAIDANQHLTLAWSQPGAGATSALRYTTTR